MIVGGQGLEVSIGLYDVDKEAQKPVVLGRLLCRGRVPGVLDRVKSA